MNYLRKLLLFLGIMLLLTIGVSAASYTFTTMTGTCDVDNNGTCHFTVSGVITFHETVSEFSIPLGQNVSKAETEIYTTSVRKENGGSALVFEREAGFSGEMNVTWSYTIRNTVSNAASSQLFSVPLMAAQAGDVTNLSYTINMPGTFTANPVFTSGYYADGIDNYMDVSVSDGVITATVNQTLMAGDALTLSLTTEQGYFSMHNVAGRTITVDNIILALCWPLAIVLWFFKLRYPFPKITVRAHPPTGANAGVLRTILTNDTPDLALMCANWASAGYLDIHHTRDGSVCLRQRMPMGNERDIYETKVFQALFSKSSSVFAGTKKYASVEQYAAKPVFHFWQQRLFKKNAPKPYLLRTIGVLGGLSASLCAADTAIASVRFRLIPVILLAIIGGCLCWLIQRACICCLHRNPSRPITIGIICAVILQVGAALAGAGGTMFAAVCLQILIGLSLVFGVKRSNNGVHMLEQTLSLWRYLKKFKASDVQQLQGQSQYYYQMLPYAEALGMGQKFTRTFAGITLEPCNWYTHQDNITLRDPQQFYTSFHNCIKSMHGEDGPNFLQRLQMCLTRLLIGKKHKKKKIAASANRSKHTVPDRRSQREYNHEYHRNNDPARHRE